MENRIIKFRVWDINIPKNEGELENPTGMMVDHDYVIKSDYLIDGISGKYPIMQFTGLTDKNSKEIYEGDITDAGETVIFQNGCFRTTFEDNRQGNAILTEARTRLMEIIGNTFENPELLKN